MYFLYKLYFRSAHTELDSIKLSGAITDALITLFPDRSEEIITEIMHGSFAVSDPFPISSKNADLLYPVPEVTYSYPVNETREKRLEQAKSRKTRIAFSTLERIKEFCSICSANNGFETTKMKANEILSTGDSSLGDVPVQEYGVSSRKYANGVS